MLSSGTDVAAAGQQRAGWHVPWGGATAGVGQLIEDTSRHTALPSPSMSSLVECELLSSTHPVSA